MSGYVLRTAESKAVKKLIKKYGTVQIQTESIDGVIEIVGYRTYMGHEEVDINFKGKIFVGVGYSRIWVDYNYYQSEIKSISKIKLTRFFRKKCLDVVQTQMLFFGARINYTWHIKKVKWIG
jgi:hypothetical protein